MGYGVMILRFLMTFGTQKNDKSYHDQLLIRLSCDENFVENISNCCS